LARLEVHQRSPDRPAPDRLRAPPADHLEQGSDSANPDALLVSARALLVRAKEERPLVRQARRELDCLGLSVPEVHYGRFGRGKVRPSDPEANGGDAAAPPQPHSSWR